ncbi:hypothetical protein K438DRAFT_1779623 [Mycena galopus ATCC 62051]|nr:hypothetical protein K438DRAFT_1779623 [Mycena galopus ATCC 62051]
MQKPAKIPYTRPAHIPELKAAAADTYPAQLGLDFPQYLELAETHDNAALAYASGTRNDSGGSDSEAKQLDIERAFIECYTAATIYKSLWKHQCFSKVTAEQKSKFAVAFQRHMKQLKELTGCIGRASVEYKQKERKAQQSPLGWFGRMLDDYGAADDQEAKKQEAIPTFMAASVLVSHFYGEEQGDVVDKT